jgi:hypothetical protein
MKTNLLILTLSLICLASSVALYFEVSAHNATLRKLQIAESEHDEAWKLIQELRSTVTALQ